MPALVADVLHSLSAALLESGAAIDVAELPTIRSCIPPGGILPNATVRHSRELVNPKSNGVTNVTRGGRGTPRAAPAR
jgi:hypothetical protein